MGMPRTLLCTVRVQREGAGGETKPEHRGGRVGNPRRGEGSKCHANCFAPCVPGRVGRTKEGQRANKGRGERGRQGRREKGEKGSE